MKTPAAAVLCILLTAVLTGCQTSESIVLVSAAQDAEPAQVVSVSTRSAATALLASLSDEQREKTQHDIKAPLRKDWHFVPRERQGLMLGDMDAKQKTLVHKLMQTALSDSGYLKATDIIWLETVLYEMSNQNPIRDPGKYVLQIFGDPADEQAAWGWRLEGHHLSLNLTYTPEGIGVTPLFFGTNPAVVQQGPLAGKRILAGAHNLAIELAKSMNDEQRKKMMLGKKPRDVITGPGREAGLRQPSGIRIDESDDQSFLLWQLMQAHINNYNEDHLLAVETRQEQWIRKNLERRGSGHEHPYHFAWAGPIGRDQPFYYRIYCPTFVIEYSCQNRNHVHAVIHDLTDPLQEDLLKKHFEQHGH